MDKCEAHGKPDTLPELDNVEIEFLLKYAISKIQPLEAGIIAAMKRQYRKRHIDNSMSLLDCDAKHIYNASQLQGTMWMRAVWNELSSDSTKNCWQHTYILEKHSDVEPLINPSWNTYGRGIS